MPPMLMGDTLLAVYPLPMPPMLMGDALLARPGVIIIILYTVIPLSDKCCSEWVINNIQAFLKR